MILIIKLILIITLGILFIQDVKERQVYWFLFPIIALCCGFLFYNRTLPELFYVYIGMNSLIVCILLFVAFTYTKLKLKMNFSDAFGLGDILLFIGLIFSFATLSFLTIFVFALCFSLITHLVVKKRSTFNSVPLAGYMSLFFALTYISHWFGITNSLYTF